MPMFVQGLAGINRRLYDGGIQYAHGAPLQHLNVIQGWAAWIMFAFQLVFIVNFFWSMKGGRKVGQNPWDATTLEWAAPSPPPHGNFATQPEVFRGPYEYSVPGHATDFTPQFQPDAKK
jgi:cytochrome c oxidase subunit 1